MTFEVGYFVTDASAAAAFYTSNLGCVEVARMTLPESVTRPTGLGDPAVLIAVKTPNGMTVKFLESSDGLGSPATHNPHDHYLTFYTSTLDDLSELLLAGGATAHTDQPADIPAEFGGGRMRFLTDPQGNVIELIEAEPQV